MAAMSEILQKMEQCRDMVQGRSQYAPKSKKDVMWTLKASRRMHGLEKEEVQMMYRPQMVPKYNKTQPTEDPDEDYIEECTNYFSLVQFSFFVICLFTLP